MNKEQAKELIKAMAVAVNNTRGENALVLETASKYGLKDHEMAVILNDARQSQVSREH